MFGPSKNSCCTKSHRLLCLFLRKRDVLVQNTLKTHPYLKNLLCDCARGSSVHPPHNGALPFSCVVFNKIKDSLCSFFEKELEVRVPSLISNHIHWNKVRR